MTNDDQGERRKDELKYSLTTITKESRQDPTARLCRRLNNRIMLCPCMQQPCKQCVDDWWFIEQAWNTRPPKAVEDAPGYRIDLERPEVAKAGSSSPYRLPIAEVIGDETPMYMKRPEIDTSNAWIKCSEQMPKIGQDILLGNFRHGIWWWCGGTVDGSDDGLFVDCEVDGEEIRTDHYWKPVTPPIKIVPVSGEVQ